MIDTLVAKSDTQAQAEGNVFIQEAFSILTPLQKKVIARAIFEGATEQEIAQEMGITHQCVHKIKERGLKRLRKKFVREKSHRQVEPYPGRTTTLTQG
jgi:RNA polymerase sigma factor (sigma-70 family)